MSDFMEIVSSIFYQTWIDFHRVLDGNWTEQDVLTTALYGYELTAYNEYNRILQTPPPQDDKWPSSRVGNQPLPNSGHPAQSKLDAQISPAMLSMQNKYGKEQTSQVMNLGEQMFLAQQSKKKKDEIKKADTKKLDATELAKNKSQLTDTDDPDGMSAILSDDMLARLRKENPLVDPASEFEPTGMQAIRMMLAKNLDDPLSKQEALDKFFDGEDVIL